MKSKLIALSASLMLVLAGCSNEANFTPATSSGSSQETVNVESITLDKTSLTLSVGQIATLTATVTSDSPVSVIWESSNAHVTVDDGVVTAVSGGTATVTARAGDKSASCEVTVLDDDARPDDAVDLQYSTGEDLPTHNGAYCYFNDPEKWSGATAEVNEAYYSPSQNRVLFDYTYDPTSNPGENKWSVQLNKENDSLVDGQKYSLTFKLKSNVAGSIVVNGANVSIVTGENNIAVTYTEQNIAVGDHIASFALQFPFQTFGSARVSISNVEWKDPSGPANSLEYSTGEDLASHGDNYCYFNDPKKWSGATAEVNEATYVDGVLTFDYTYDPTSNPGDNKWSVQLMRENSSLVDGQTYTLSFNMNSNKAGSIIVNGEDTNIVVGDNTISVTYVEQNLAVGDHVASFAIQFPFQTFGSARVVITNIAWNEAGGGGGGGGGSSTISAPEGVVVNPIGGGQYIVAFAAVAGATGYKAYYVNFDTGVDVDNEPVTNGGPLNKVSSLAEGKYKVFVTAFKDEEESARSESFGVLNLGGEVDLVPPVGIVVNPVAEGHIIAFAPVAGATSYQVYYVNASTSADVDNEEVQNGGLLTKEASLPSGTYHCYVTSKAGGKESARSEGYGVLTVA